MVFAIALEHIKSEATGFNIEGIHDVFYILPFFVPFFFPVFLTQFGNLPFFFFAVFLLKMYFFPVFSFPFFPVFLLPFIFTVFFNQK